MTCVESLPSPHPEGVPWGASSDAHHRELGKQLSGLKDLIVHGQGTTLLRAISATACSAPILTGLRFCVNEGKDDLELPPICSASLKSITGLNSLTGLEAPPPPVILTILVGCTQLRDVHVLFLNMPKVGTCVKICCQCHSRACMVSLEGHAASIDDPPSGSCAGLSEVGVRLMPVLASHRVCSLTRPFTHYVRVLPEQAPASCPVCSEACITTLGECLALEIAQTRVKGQVSHRTCNEFPGNWKSCHKGPLSVKIG